ncbi:DUF3800 domain-containing protein [Streptomyces sp. JJ36]|uniref:DUF3800 domain-containing protein n=1 Tax=Streptomyces sp. JJ36 TaxID=2736645 RepID=UPI001F32026B|nr:DUF3800 domain-containing protein [Streptomyces sp. JJ36]MCF6522135.1 DUF3800 domain-containing protein [Streptomyces sp. JJ36]
MHLCYIDEAGNGQMLTPAAPAAPPVLVIGGFTVDRTHVKSLTWDFLQVKKQFRPQLRRFPHLSEVIRTEIKGSDVRRDLRAGNRNSRRAALLLIDALLGILERYDARVLARVWVKEEGRVVDETGVYSSSISALTENFQEQLAHEHSRGMLVLDSRTKVKNAPNVHCVTTRKYRSGGDGYRGIIESPVFGHSDTHTLLQLADLLVSSMLFPLACQAYTSDLTWNVHCDGAYESLRRRIGERLRKRQFRWRDPGGKWKGGIVVSDRRFGRSGSWMLSQRASTKARIPAPAGPARLPYPEDAPPLP